tara:strand:+ start:1006 stop:1305 length:300 start_codon:yes stop_codon:yes gene_type:complete
LAIVDTLNEHSFINRFLEIRKDSFSVKALRVLYHYYDDMSEGIGDNIEFDPIAICCEWAEYDTEQECLDDYGHYEDIEEIRANTVVLPVYGDSILVQSF